MTAEERAIYLESEILNIINAGGGAQECRTNLIDHIRFAEREARAAAIKECRKVMGVGSRAGLSLDECEAFIADLAGMTQAQIVERMRSSIRALADDGGKA